jgi:S-adenosylmethionine decarboxylase
MLSKRSWHYTADLYGVDLEKCKSKYFIKSVINDAVNMSNLKKIETTINVCPNGIMAYCLIATSHISIHTFAPDNFVMCDVFSCGKKEGVVKAMDHILKHFQAKKVKKKLFVRG